MRNSIRFIALAGALAAAPAVAQVNVGLGARVGVGVGVDAGRTIGDVRGTLDRTVDRTDRTLNRTLSSDLVVASRADVRSGAVVRDSRGGRVGTVQSVHGNTAVVVRGDRRFHVPLASLYRSSIGLVTRMSRAQLRASAQADVAARADLRR